MTTQHTAGPWHVSGKRYHSDMLRVFTEMCDTVAMVPSTPFYQRDEANARLIAAAPELYSALQGMVAAFNVNEIDPLVAFATIERARAAVKKVGEV